MTSDKGAAGGRAGGSAAALRLVGAVDAAGVPVEVRCDNGRITSVRRGAPAGPVVERTAAGPVTTVELPGMTLLPALAEPHAHVDKAYTADRYVNATGDLDGAIAASHRCFAERTAADIAADARRALGAYLAKGCLSVRTHVAIGPVMGLRSMEGVRSAVADYAGLVDVQVVAHVAPPVHGRAGRANLALLREAIAMGATQVGGTPYRDDDPVAETAALVEAAAAAEVPLDLHTDETLDPGCLTVVELARVVQARRFPFAVTASHCVSLGVQDEADQRRVAELLAEAGVAVVSLPQTNLYLQGRGTPRATPRGLTALGALRAAGCRVAAGGDNVQDPFNPMGRADPLEAASLLVTAGHLDTAAAFALVSEGAREVMGLEPVALVEGSPADLVAVPGAGLREVVAEGDARRVVVRRGEVVRPSRAAHPTARAREVAHV